MSLTEFTPMQNTCPAVDDGKHSWSDPAVHGKAECLFCGELQELDLSTHGVNRRWGIAYYEVDFGDEGKGIYVRREDFERIVRELATPQPPKPAECTIECPPMQVCDHCAWPPGKDKEPPKPANGEIVRGAIAILSEMPSDRIEYNEELSALIRKLKPAGAVPMPDRHLIIEGRFVPHSAGPYCLYDDAIRYGDAREAAARGAGRADAVPAYPKPDPKSLSAGAIVAGMIVRHKYAEAHPGECDKPTTSLADLEHLAAHLQHATPQPAGPLPETDGDLVLIERGLIGAACHAIDKKRDAPNLLAKLRAVTFANPATQQMTTQGEASGTVSGYLPKQRAVEVKLDADVPEWMKVKGVRVSIIPTGSQP